MLTDGALCALCILVNGEGDSKAADGGPSSKGQAEDENEEHEDSEEDGEGEQVATEAGAAAGMPRFGRTWA